jgi:hypothetical protein
MPKLKSGRHFAVESPDLAEKLKSGTSDEIYSLVVLYRMNVRKPEDIIPLLSVVYFKEQGDPPGSPYRSGFLIRDILEGKAKWTREEITEFRGWLDGNKKLKAAVAAEFVEINKAIEDSLVWDSDDGPAGPRH